MSLFRITRHVGGDIFCEDRFEVSQDTDTSTTDLIIEDDGGGLERTWRYSKVLRRVAKVKWSNPSNCQPKHYVRGIDT